MHLAKGLEFRAVVVMACDQGVLPLDERMADAADEAELDETYETERRLLYVTRTRAREHLSLTGVRPASEYLDDSTQQLPLTATRAPAAPSAGFDRKWCPEEDSNLHDLAIAST